MMQKKFALATIAILFFVFSAKSQTTIRINAGGPAYTDSQGQLWSADYGFNTGTPSSCAPAATVTGTADPQLYKSARWDPTHLPEMQYAFSLPNGVYRVTLYFAETCAYTAGMRVFDVQVQGNTLYPGIDIAKAVGVDRPFIESENASVTLGQLTIGFVHHVDNPIISAIEIVPAGPVTAPAISSQPVSTIVPSGQAAVFSVAATGTYLTYQWQKNGSAIPGATTSTYMTPATSIADSGALFSVVVSNSAGSVTSNNAALTVNPPSATALDVITYHNDNARTGQNLNETTLTLANVNQNTFGLNQIVTLDGRVDAQPLFLSSVSVAGQGTRNVVYAVTEHDSVYALDAATGAVLWQVSTLSNGETPSDPRGCGQVSPEIGITSTPVIDRTRGPNGAIYVVAMSKNSAGSYFQRLYAFDITSGAQLFGGPHTITATYPGTGDNSSGGNVIFDPAQYKERAGLLMIGGQIYTTWASHCDNRPYTGWIMSFDANTLAAVNVLNLTPNGSDGAIWMSGAAPAADANGNIILLDANGTMDTTLTEGGFPSQGDYGNCFCKISTAGGLTVADYFAMSNTVSESNSDTDLGSGAALVLPDLTDGAGNALHLAVGAGKDGNIYVVNLDNMGKFNPNANNIYQQLTGAITGAWSMPAYFNNTVYYATQGDVMKAFTITNGKLSGSPTSRAQNTLPYPGATPSVSANGSTNGIVWSVGNGSGAFLDAYDAGNVSHELYNSNQASNGRDHFGTGNKFMTPTIANGHVYIGTPTGLAIFGLLP